MKNGLPQARVDPQKIGYRHKTTCLQFSPRFILAPHSPIPTQLTFNQGLHSPSIRLPVSPSPLVYFSITQHLGPPPLSQFQLGPHSHFQPWPEPTLTPHLIFKAMAPLGYNTNSDSDSPLRLFAPTFVSASARAPTFASSPTPTFAPNPRCCHHQAP